MKGKSVSIVAALFVLLLAMVVGGCAKKLTDKESMTVANFQLDVSSEVLIADGYDSTDSAMDPEVHFDDLYETTPEVIAIARKKPDAIYDAGDEKLTMRQVLSDAAADLSSADPETSDQLRLAIETLPK